MNTLARIADAGARKAWLRSNRNRFNGSGTSMPRLLVDVSAIIRHDAQTGIQRVVRSVWSELSKRDDVNFRAQPVYATSRRGYCYAPVDFLDSRPLSFDGAPAGLGAGDRFLGLDLSAHLLPKYAEQLRAWRKNGGTIHVFVYDLLPLEHPGWFTEAAGRHFRRWFELLATEVDEAICISDHVARRFVSMLNGRSIPRVKRVRMGTDMAASRPSTGLSSDVISVVDRMRSHCTILMVGTIEPRKGYDAALAAFEYLWREGRADAPSLVIVGKAGWKTAELQRRLSSHPESGNRLNWLDSVSDEGLGQLYDASRGVMVASRGEGFGLPLVEASTHGRFILARDLPVFREQGLANVIYFQSDEPASLAAKVMDLARARPRPTGPVVLPSWRETVDDLLTDLGLRTNELRPEASLCVAR